MLQEDDKAVKYDEGKIRMDLLPPFALQSIARVFQFGAKKYAPYNWAKGMEYSRLYAALQRHLSDYWSGKDKDDETGMSHLWHAGCCLMMLIDLQEFHPDLDDRPKIYTKHVANGQFSGHKGSNDS